MPILFLILFIASCHANTELDEAIAPPSLAEQDPPFCNGYVSKADCDDGDSALFAGLVCLAGMDDGCRTVEDSQDDEGRFWRSPRRKGGNLGRHNSFSRDMALGVLAYLVAESDKQAAIDWWAWIWANRPCGLKIGSKCLVYGWPRYCRDDTDNRCLITPTMLGAMYRVWVYLGLKPPALMAKNKRAPILRPTRTGYPLHLYGVHELIKQKMGYPRNVKAINHMLKLDSTNIFFIYLMQGKSLSFDYYYEDYCRGYAGDRSQWAWERDSKQRAWYDSMGWDCLFIKSI